MSRKVISSEGEASNWKKLVTKAFIRESEWPDKDELLDVIYWGKQILALMIGISWGIIPLHGLLAIVLYIGISTIFGQLYIANFQKMNKRLVVATVKNVSADWWWFVER